MLADSLLSAYKFTEANKELDTYLQNEKNKNEQDSVYFSLLQYDKRNKQFQPFTTGSDSMFTPIYKYYEKKGSNYEKMRVNYLMGSIYRDLEWPTEAQRYFHKAISLSESVAESYDKNKLLMMIYGQIGELYRYKVNLDLSIEMSKKSIKYARKINDKLFISNSLRKIASCMTDKGEYAKALKLCLKTYPDLLELKEDSVASSCLLQIADIYIKMSDFSKAKTCLEKYEKDMNIKSPLYEISPGYNHETYYSIKASYFFDTNKIDSAIYFCMKLTTCKDKDYHIGAYDCLAFCYAKKGNKDSVIKYQDLCLLESRATNEAAIANQIQELQSNFDVSIEREKTTKAIIQKQETENKALIIIILLGVIIVVTAILLLIKKKRYAQLLNQYQRVLFEIKSEKDKMNVLMAQDRQDEFSKQENKVATAINKAKAIEENLSVDNLIRLRLDTFQQTPIVTHLYECAMRNQKVTEDDWNTLFHTITEITPPIAHFMKLRYGKMQDSDYKLCLLVIVGIPPKHIKEILCCTFQKISMQRKRYLKIFFDKEGKPSDFDDMLRSLR